MLNNILTALSGILADSSAGLAQPHEIALRIENLNQQSKHILGFSIKSFLGSNSTLFNAAPGTNFIYRVDFPEGMVPDVEKFNIETYSLPIKIKSRIKLLTDKYHANLIFEKVQSDCLSQNLRTIDGDLPILMAQLILARYTKSASASIKDCTEALTQLNPLGFDIIGHGQVYEYKIKRFLHDCALGMTPETPWTGIYDATGGQIIVKEDGDIVCYHIYELNRFMDYLYTSTKLEEASTSEDSDRPGHAREKKPDDKNPPKPFKYGWLYKENGNIYIKLNLQIRFK